VEPDAVEIRVVACLVEKQRTTPDQYPLTLNSLRLACNQSTNRDPVVDYEDATIRSALDRLTRRRWTTLASWSTARSVKYKHLLDHALGLDSAQLALLSVLMLRGPQTAAELRTRSERMHRFESAAEAEATLASLAERGLAEPLPKRPGERGERWTHRLEGAAEVAEPSAAAAPAPDSPPLAPPAPPLAPPAPPRAAPAPPPLADDGLALRVERLESEVAALRDQLAALREDLGA
jgi:uncharacterized protein YceH (UPF0502 family)